MLSSWLRKRAICISDSIGCVWMGKLGTPSNLSIQEKTVKKVFVMITAIAAYTLLAPSVQAKRGPSTFYDFQSQLIDGQVRTPTVEHTNSRRAVEFERLLYLKKSFAPVLFSTSKDRLFK